MHTFNVRQLRALSIVAPGTLALRDDSNYARLVLITTEDDRQRSGIERIEVDQSGNVVEFFTMGRLSIRTRYADLLQLAAELD